MNVLVISGKRQRLLSLSTRFSDAPACARYTEEGECVLISRVCRGPDSFLLTNAVLWIEALRVKRGETALRRSII